MSHGMTMYFHTNVHNTILFKEWHTMTWQELLGSCIGIAVIAALYEGLKVGREYLEARMTDSGAHNTKTVATPRMAEAAVVCECNATDEASTRTNADSTTIAIGDDDVKKNKRSYAIISKSHLVQTALHFVQLWIGFCLMLVFMTFSVYLCVAITVGGALGYFCFAWLRPHPRQLYTANFTADCCN